MVLEPGPLPLCAYMRIWGGVGRGGYSAVVNGCQWARYIFMYESLRVCIHICMHICMHVCKVCMHICKCTNIHVGQCQRALAGCTSMEMHTQTYTYKYLHIQSWIIESVERFSWNGMAVCCSVMQCVAGCCSVLQCVAVCCSVHVFTYTILCHGLYVHTLAHTYMYIRMYVYICIHTFMYIRRIYASSFRDERNSKKINWHKKKKRHLGGLHHTAISAYATRENLANWVDLWCAKEIYIFDKPTKSARTPFERSRGFSEWLRENTFRRWRRTHEKGVGRHADASDEANAERWRCVDQKLNGQAHQTWMSQLIYSHEVLRDQTALSKNVMVLERWCAETKRVRGG